MIVAAFAERCAAYLGGSEYGHSGNIPTDAELPATVQDGIARAVGYGRLAAQAMNDGNAVLASDYRGRFMSHHRAVLEHVGMTFGQWDLCYQIGYNAIRKD